MSRAPFVLVLVLALVLSAALSSWGCVVASPAPAAPALGLVDSPTSVDVLRLRGTKQAATSVEIRLSSGGNARDSVVVPIDDATQWAVDVDLQEGDNRLDVSTVDGAGRRSDEVTVVVVLDTAPPDAPELEALPPFTALDSVDVAGEVSPGDDVVINGFRHAVGGGDFNEDVALTVGENRVRVAARDVAGNESEVADFVVVRVAELSFTLDPTPALLSEGEVLTLSGTRGDGVEVVVDNVVVIAATEPPGPGGAWRFDVATLPQGPNTIEVVGRFPGEDETAVAFVVDLVVDNLPPASPQVDALPAFTALASVDVTGNVAPQSTEQVVVNGTASAPDSVATGAFSVPVALVLGDNTITVTARDPAGGESPPVVQTVERVAAVPFTTDAPPALVGAADLPFSLSGTRGDGVEVRVDGVVVVAANAPAGPWSAVVTLVDGNNTFDVTGGFPNEPSTARIDKLVVAADLTGPVVFLDAPVDGDLAGNALTVLGSATDANGAAVRVCMGLPRAVDPLACIDDDDYAPAAIAGDDFSIAFDLTGVSGVTLSDGDPGTVYVRAEDTLGNSVEVVRDVLVFRAPLVVVEAVGAVNGVDLARPTVAPVGGDDATVSGALVWTNTVGDAGLALDEDEGPGAEEVAWRPQDFALAAGTATASDVHVASNAGTVHTVWIDSGDLMYAQAGGGAIEVVDGAVNPVTSVDVAFDEDASANGTEAVIAFVQNVGGSAVDAVVRTTVSTTFAGTTTFSTPVTVSDAITLSPSDVTVAAGGLAVAWLETSARDGLLDDADVVLVARSNGVAGTPVLVSATQGGFADAASAAPRLATLGNGDVAVAWIEDAATPTARGVATLVDVTALPSPIVPAPVDVTAVTGSGAAAEVFVEVDSVAGGNALLIGWLDDGPALLDGAAAPVLVVRRAVTLSSLGAPVVVPSDGASSPAGFLDGAFATLAWVEGGDALLYVVEVP